MTDVVIQLNELSAIWGQQMWQASWQGGLALLLVFLVSRAVRHMPVEFTCWLWRLAFLKFIIAGVCIAPLLISVPLPFEKGMPSPLPEASDAMHETPAALPVHSVLDSRSEIPSPLPKDSPATTGPQLSRTSWLFIAWGAGVVLCVTHFLKQCLQIRRTVATLPKVDDEYVLQRVIETCRQMGVKGIPDVRVTNVASSPLLFGFVRPTIVLPSFVLGSSSDETLNVAIAHELAHVKRRDLLWNWLPALIRMSFFFHPLVWLAQREWRLVQETATDKLAIASSRLTNEQYAMTLLELISKCTVVRKVPPVAIAVSDAYSQLNRRIIAMQRFQNVVSRRVTIVSVVLLFIGVAALLPLTVSTRAMETPSIPENSTDSDDTTGKKKEHPAITAAKSFGPEYSLEKGEILKRIAPPYPPGRQAYIQKENSHPAFGIFPWSDDGLRIWSETWEDFELGARISTLLPPLCKIGPERLRGNQQLMEQWIKGDFVVRADAPREAIVAELEEILNATLESPLQLTLGETEEDVYIVRGKVDYSNVVRDRQDVLIIDSARFEDIGSIEQAVRAPGEANFEGFLDQVGRSLEMPFVSEVESPPEELRFRSIRTRVDQELITRPYNLQAAVDSLADQTGLTFSKERRKILTLTVKAAGVPEPPQQEVSSTRTEANENSEPSFESRLASAIEQFGDEYTLDEKQVVKRIFPALPVKRAGFFRILNNGKYKEIFDRPEFCVVLHWRDKDIPFWTQMTFGPEAGVSIRSLLPVLCDIGGERLRGDDELMNQIVPGDFVVMHDGPREEIVEELETIVNDAVKSPVELKLGETEEDVYVVRGTFELSDDVKGRDDLVMIESLSDTYSRPVRPDFDGFVEILVRATGVPILSEVETPPAKVKLVTKQQTAERSQFNLQAALDSLSAQTGLTFTKEKRKILTLTVAERE